MGQAELSQEELIAKYQKILKDNGSTEIVEKVEVNSPKLIGEHMASVCLYVTLHFTNGKKQELFVKQLPSNAAHLAMLVDWNLFEKESYFFNVILKDMQKYYLGKTGSKKPMDFFPTCFHADDKEIILENLVKDKGYYLNSKLDRQDLETVKMTLKNLAQFHAVGYAMTDDIGYEAMLQKHKELKEVAYLPDSSLLHSMFDNMTGSAVSILNNSNVPKGKETLVRLQSQVGGGNIAIRKVCELFNDESLRTNIFNCINHGDCWNNNMLFLRDPNTNALIHNVLLDFQVMRLSSPNNDLVYYIFTSTKTALRRKHWKELLQFYFGQLETFVLELKKPFPFTFDQFLKDFLKKIPLGFWMNSLFSIGMEIMHEIDMTKAEGDIGEYVAKIMKKWFDENPDKTNQLAIGIVELWDEFDDLQALL